jgi:phosphosulfolactate synthase (CoM biosynthesis protein A)
MARIEIEIEDILWDMSDYEKQELVDELYDDGFVAKKDIKNTDGEFNEWDEAVRKLYGNAWRLSKEDEQTILNITKKIIL